MNVIAQAKVPATIFIKPKTGNCIALINFNTKSNASHSTHKVIKLNITSISSKKLMKALASTHISATSQGASAKAF